VTGVQTCALPIFSSTEHIKKFNVEQGECCRDAGIFVNREMGLMMNIDR